MIDGNQFLFSLLAKCPAVKGVDEEVLNSFIKKTNLELRPDHFDFLLNYGNSTALFTSMFADCTFSEFTETYLNKAEDLDGDLPESTTYFGGDFSDDPLCIENMTGSIYGYDCKKLDFICYKNINSFVFYSLLFNSSKSELFKNVEMNIKVNTQDFMSQYQAYKLTNLETYDYHFYLIYRTIYSLDFRKNLVHAYELKD